MKFSGHHDKQDTWCPVIHEMPLFFLSLEPGSDTYLNQETLYCTGVNLVEGYGRMLPVGLQRCIVADR